MKTTDRTLDEGQAVGTQHAALCYRDGPKGRIEVLLITSRDTGRWIIPKGWPVRGLDAPDTAEREAWEEAGVKGRIARDCLGVYSYGKVMDDASVLPTLVTVYPMKVSKLARSYPEVGDRRRKWFSAAKAATKVDEPELATLIARFQP